MLKRSEVQTADMAGSDSETTLVALATTGDRAAIQQLLMLYHDRLAAVIRPKIPADLRGTLSAEDVCQEAYVAVFRQMTSFHPHDERAFQRWLHTIADRKLVDVIRRQRARKRGGGKAALTSGDDQVSSVVELLDVVAVHERTPSRSAAHRELVLTVQGALEKLKDEHRDALRLHYIQALTVAETAERMGRTEGAVLMLCNRGLRRLGEVIGDPTRFFSRKG
jgi:RNA polymerase sigma-70 factor (ECF subfamily)